MDSGVLLLNAILMVSSWEIGIDLGDYNATIIQTLCLEAILVTVAVGTVEGSICFLFVSTEFFSPLC